jgi:hypothetical protein
VCSGTRSPRTRCVPSPACGGGLGRGHATRLMRASSPPPHPSPVNGGGSRPSVGRVKTEFAARGDRNTCATSRSSSPNRVRQSYSLVKQHVFLRSRGAFLRPGFVSFASRTLIEGWRSAERRTDACEASVGPALTGQARHLARRLASPYGGRPPPGAHTVAILGSGAALLSPEPRLSLRFGRFGSVAAELPASGS